VTRRFGRGVAAEHRSYKYVLFLLLLLMVILPFLEAVPFLGFLVEGLLLLALIAGAWSTGAGKWVFISLVVLGVGILANTVIGYRHPSSSYTGMQMGLQVIALSIVTLWIARDVLSGGVVDANRVMGSACIYLLLGFIWTSLYSLVEALLPGSFRGISEGAHIVRFDLWYFSMVTLTTLGYGDITPLSPAAKSLAVVEAVTGQLILVILVARTVGLHTALFGGEKK
jgi:hypothetical protein